jgi:hypothetical protein
LSRPVSDPLSKLLLGQTEFHSAASNEGTKGWHASLPPVAWFVFNPTFRTQRG